MIFLGTLPLALIFISFCICWNCESSWLISLVRVPLPAAMRLRRLPPIMAGFCLSWGVIERTMASTFFSCSSWAPSGRRLVILPMPGSISANWPKAGPPPDSWPTRRFSGASRNWDTEVCGLSCHRRPAPAGESSLYSFFPP